MSFPSNPFKVLWRRLPKPLRNRYFLVISVFTIWMVLFDKHNLFTQISLQGTMNKLNDDKKYYLGKIDEVKADHQDYLKNSEKFAREKYFMSRPGEDVFIIEKK